MSGWIRSRVLYTPPVTPWELVIPEAGSLTDLSEGAIEGRISDWGEVVTRYPYENVGMDHLLSMELSYRKTTVWELRGLNLRIRKFSLVIRFWLVLLGFERSFDFSDFVLWKLDNAVIYFTRNILHLSSCSLFSVWATLRSQTHQI